jgi:hypothetical protein
MNTTTGAQRHNARQDKIWQACQQAKAQQRDTAQTKSASLTTMLENSEALSEAAAGGSWRYEREFERLEADRSKILAHAERLAEALRDVTTAAEIVDGSETPEDSDIEHMLDCFQKAHEALAQWEGAKQ